MRRRIRAAIVGVTAIVLLVLGIPLVIAVHRYLLDAEVVELQAAAATALTEIATPFARGQLRALDRDPDVPASAGVYDADGRKLAGDGPSRADATTRSALRGRSSSSVDGEIVVATPITAAGSERVLGALRVTESLADAEQRARTAWFAMAGAGAGALGLAGLIGNRLSQTLTAPLSELAERAATIGEEGGVAPQAPSGIEEIDALARALADRSDALTSSIARERRFGADVSHQLRTPLTALRLKVEEGLAGEAEARSALADLDRIDQTIDHLLAVARDATPRPGPIDIAEATRATVERWRPRVTAAGRTLTLAPTQTTVGCVHRTSIDQVLDVLIDNAIRHGAGIITVSVRGLNGAAAIEVADEGTSIGLLDSERIFEHGHGTDHGIGLAVARSIADAEGGRLLLRSHQPTTFSLVVMGPDPDLPSVDLLMDPP